MFYLHGKGERCQTVPTLFKAVLFYLYSGKLWSYIILQSLFSNSASATKFIKEY